MQGKTTQKISCCKEEESQFFFHLPSKTQKGEERDAGYDLCGRIWRPSLFSVFVGSSHFFLGPRQTKFLVAFHKAVISFHASDVLYYDIFL